MESQRDSSETRFHLFNCDRTYSMDAVAELLDSVKAELPFKLSVEQHPFPLSRMRDLTNRVLVVIGGDDNYKDQEEEDTCVLSRWAKRKIMSQFTEDFLNGSTSFIFSWEKKHRPIHEEALQHLLLPGNEGKKFEPKPRPPVEDGSRMIEPEPAPTPIYPDEPPQNCANDGTGNGNIIPSKLDCLQENGQGDEKNPESGETKGEEQHHSEPVNEESPLINRVPHQKNFTFRATLQNGEVTMTERPDFHIPEAIAENWRKQWGNVPNVRAEIQVVNNELKAVSFRETWAQWLRRLCNIL